MSKFLYSVLAFICLLVMFVAYFQNFHIQSVFNFFNKTIHPRTFILYISLFATWFWMFATLAIKAVLSSSKEMDESFEL